MSDKGLEAELAHEHCLNCIRLNCLNKASCALIYCQAGCGFRFHSCKEEDHKLVCMKEKVPCINKLSGCPREMSRENIAKHLPSCPANVILCKYEWNRWPMHSQEEGWKAPMPFKNPHVKCGQFDVAFALRDQKVLMDSFKLPRKTRRILRNAMTRHYPAVPIQSHSSMIDSITSESSLLSDDDTGTPWDLNQSPPGLQRTISNQLALDNPRTKSNQQASDNHLYEASKKATESLTKALDYVTGAAGLKRLAEVAKKQEEALKAIDQAESARKELSQSDSQSDSILSSQTLPDLSECQLGDNSEPRGNCDTRHPDIDNTVKDEEEDELDIYCTEKQLYQVLGLDLTMHFISSYQPKPPKMFTFVCGQEFRRDEYAWHERNIHSDIQANLNHWFEQRCPLAYAGCTFSFQRFKPKNPRGAIVHSPVLQSLGLAVDEEFENDKNHTTGNLTDEEDVRTVYGRSRLREATPEIHTSCKCDSTVKVIPRYKSISREASPVKHLYKTEELYPSLTDLPFEVLQSIARRLDSFSIQHLSMTCRLMQSVCCSLLEELGLVSLVWQKRGADKEGDGEPMWQVAYKRWHFSVGTDPILQWDQTSESLGALSEHLKVCPNNQECDRNVKTSPFQMIYDFDDQGCSYGQELFNSKKNKRWRFSVGFSPVHTWDFQPDCLSAMSKHLTVCEFNTGENSNIATEPARLVYSVEESEGVSRTELMRNKRASRKMQTITTCVW